MDDMDRINKKLEAERIPSVEEDYPDFVYLATCYEFVYLKNDDSIKAREHVFAERIREAIKAGKIKTKSVSKGLEADIADDSTYMLSLHDFLTYFEPDLQLKHRMYIGKYIHGLQEAVQEMGVGSNHDAYVLGKISNYRSDAKLKLGQKDMIELSRVLEMNPEAAAIVFKTLLGERFRQKYPSLAGRRILKESKEAVAVMEFLSIPVNVGFADTFIRKKQRSD